MKFRNNALLAHEKWADYFKNCDSLERFSELLKLVQFIFSIFGHNADVERVFSLINMQWSDERRFELETVKGIALTLFNLNMECQEFHNYISKQPKVLEGISSEAKYYKNNNTE